MAILTEQETFYDINPINPTVVTEPFTIVCTNTDAVYQIGDPDGKNRRGFIVTQDSDIIVVNSSGGALVRGVGFFTTQRTADVLYSKTYVKSIYSGIKFAALGTYTVTKHIQCGTYPKAAFFNWVTLQIKIIFEAIAALTLRVTATENKNSEQDTLLSNHSMALQSHETRVTLLESNPTIIVVADNATMLALTGLKTGTTVYVVSDTDSKRAEYLYDGTAFQKTSDPDWENIPLAWSALSGIPANVSAVVSAAGVTAEATFNTLAIRDSAGRLKVASPSVAADVANKEYVDSQVLATGGGNVSTSDASSADGEIVVTEGTTGKLHKKSGVLFSTITTAISTLQARFTGDSAKASLTAYAGEYSGRYPVGYVIANLVYNGHFSLWCQYNPLSDDYPTKEVENWIFDVDSHQHTSNIAGIITIWARTANTVTDKRSWVGKWVHNTWGGWTQLTDASGKAVGLYRGTTVLQSGAMVNGTPITANFDGVLDIQSTSSGGYADFRLDSLQYLYVRSLETHFNLPIAKGQTFFMYGATAASYTLYAARS